MKTIGLLGGMSWESTALYYKLLNEGVKERLGGLHSAKVVMISVDFAPIEALQRLGEWDKAGEILADHARELETAGADFIILTTNTMHKVADQIEAATSLPFLHIADATAEAIKRDGRKKVGLLATNFTMEQDFYKGRLRDKHGLNVIVPNANDRAEIHRIIYEELCLGDVKKASRDFYIKVMDKLIKDGVEAIILGCTEITMLVGQGDIACPLYNTTELHVEAAIYDTLNPAAS